jgi:hypothetical protein
VQSATKAIGKLTDQMEDFKDETQESLNAINETNQKGNKGLAKLGKTVKGVGKGFKGAGLAAKAFIAGLGLKIFEKFTEILMQNQTIVDGLGVAFGTVSAVFTKVIDGVIDASSEFTALGDIVKNSVMVPVNLLKTSIFGVQTGLLRAQLAWEKSFLGGQDADKIKELQTDIDRVDEKVVGAAKGLSDNVFGIGKGFIQTGKELGDFTTKAVENVSKISTTQELANQERIQQLRNETEIALAENDKLQFQFQLAAERQRQIRDDVTASIDDRIKANNELKNVLDEQFKLQFANAQTALELAQAELAANPNLIANKVALIEAEKNILDVKESIAGFESEQKVNREGLELEEIELINSKSEAENARAIAKKQFLAEEIEGEILRLQKLKEISEEEEAIEAGRLEAQIERLGIGTQARQDAEQTLLDFQQEKQLEQRDLDNQIAEEKKKNAEDEKALAENVALVKLDLAMQGLELVKQVAGEGSKVGKAVAIAQATIAGIQATIEAFKTASASPVTSVFPAYPFIQAGLAAGFAAVNVAKIKSTPSGGGGASGGGSGGGAPASAPPAFNIVGEAPENQLATALGENEQKPVKAFVTSGDVTSAQALDRNIVENASI